MTAAGPHLRSGGVVEVAAVLGFQPHDIPVLVRHRLLKTLGNPAPQAPKYFASVEVEEKTRNAEWLNKATRTISNDWKKRNGKAVPLLLQPEV